MKIIKYLFIFGNLFVGNFIVVLYISIFVIINKFGCGFFSFLLILYISGKIINVVIVWLIKVVIIKIKVENMIKILYSEKFLIWVVIFFVMVCNKLEEFIVLFNDNFLVVRMIMV